MNKLYPALVHIAAGLLLLAPPLQAHHSVNGQFDSESELNRNAVWIVASVGNEICTACGAAMHEPVRVECAL